MPGLEIMLETAPKRHSLKPRRSLEIQSVTQSDYEQHNKYTDKTIFFNFKNLTKFTFETPLIYNKYKNYHKYNNRKCVSNKNFVENEEEDESKPNEIFYEILFGAK